MLVTGQPSQGFIQSMKVKIITCMAHYTGNYTVKCCPDQEQQL